MGAAPQWHQIKILLKLAPDASRQGFAYLFERGVAMVAVLRPLDLAHRAARDCEVEPDINRFEMTGNPVKVPR